MKRVEKLQALMGSHLRLQLLDLLLCDAEGLTLERASIRAACPKEDVAACLRPLSSLGVIDELDGGQQWRISADLPRELIAVMKRATRAGAAHLARDQRVRHELLHGMIGADPKMQLVTEMVRKVARLDVPVLITGETGTGKDLIARAIHELSGRAEGFFGDVNCGTLSEHLFESTVFGHARGAFTGAVMAHTGLVEKANGGTLFLDEIGELSLATQVKLLKVLQSHTFTRLGETTPRTSNFRLVSATNRHLPQMVAEGSFREDLYYRLNVFPITLPALRERLDDLPYLAEEIASRSSGLSHPHEGPALTPGAVARLRSYSWPGNIRELENVITRALIASGGEVIDVVHLPPLAGTEARVRPPRASTGLRSLVEVEREHIANTLAAVDGQISVAARVLQISRTTLYRKLREHGISVNRTVSSEADEQERSAPRRHAEERSDGEDSPLHEGRRA